MNEAQKIYQQMANNIGRMIEAKKQQISLALDLDDLVSVGNFASEIKGQEQVLAQINFISGIKPEAV